MMLDDEIKEELLPIYQLAKEGNLMAVDDIASTYLNGEGISKNREKAKYYYKKIAAHGYKRIHWDNYGLLLILIGLIHFNDNEDAEALDWFCNALDFLRNYLPREIGDTLIEEYHLFDYILTCFDHLDLN